MLEQVKTPVHIADPHRGIIAIVQDQADAAHALSSDMIQQLSDGNEMGRGVENQKDAEGDETVDGGGSDSSRTRKEMPPTTSEKSSGLSLVKMIAMVLLTCTVLQTCV